MLPKSFRMSAAVFYSEMNRVVSGIYPKHKQSVNQKEGTRDVDLRFNLSIICAQKDMPMKTDFCFLGYTTLIHFTLLFQANTIG
jgi:hypothetical protein